MTLLKQGRGNGRAFAFAIAIEAVLAAGCHGSTSFGAATSAKRRAEPVPILRQECRGDGTTVDVDNDGDTDIRHAKKDGRTTCSQLDMNFDGNPDLFRFYGPDGASVLFEQQDFDFDGRVDQQSFFRGGRVDRKELDTDFDGLVDAWMWCDGTHVARAERARRKPGRVDTWEKYRDGLVAEIQYDEDDDGLPERWELFDRGTLTEVRYDTTADGKPDRVEAADSGDQEDRPVSCDGSPLPGEAPKEPAPAAPGSDVSNPGQEQGTVPADAAADGKAAPDGDEKQAEEGKKKPAAKKKKKAEAKGSASKAGKGD